MKNLFLFLFAVVSGNLFSQDKPKVMLENGGHAANIKFLSFSEDGKQLISASDDKTCRVWDIESGVLVNTLRGEIDNANYGMLNSGAIWPGKPIVTVGGYLAPLGQALGKIRFYNYETGELLHVGRGPEGAIVSQNYSNDGKFLAAGTTNGEIAIWNLETVEPVALRGHNDGVYGVAFSPDGNQLVTGSYDKKAILWDLRVLRDTTRKLDYKVIEDHTEEIRAVEFSPDGKFFLTAGYDNRVLMYDNKGEFVKEVIKVMDEEYEEKYSFGDIHAMDISDNGKFLVIGTGLSKHDNVWVVDLATGEKINSFSMHNNTVMAVDFFGNDLIASAGGDQRDIYVWNAKNGKVKAHFIGKGDRVYKVAIGKNNQVAFGQTGHSLFDRKLNDFGTLETVFDIDNLSVYPIGNILGFQGAVESKGDYQIVSRGATVYLADKDMQGVASAELNPNTDGTVRCYTFTEDGKIVVGTNYRIIVFDENLNRLRNLQGHTADIYSVASVGNLLVSGSADQTIRIWDLNDEGEYAMTRDEYKQSLFDQGITEEQLTKYLEDNGMTWDEFYNQSFSKSVVPKATIVPAGNDWIIYTKENYYATSRNGSRLVGFHMNRGMDKEAKFHSFRQYDILLNRPDKIMEIFNSQNKELIAATIEARKKRIKRSGFTVNEDNRIGNAPDLSLDNLPEVVRQKKYKLHFKLSGNNLYQMHVYVNGVPVQIMGGNDLVKLNEENREQIIIYMCSFDLIPGKNHIELWATNTEGITSTVESVTVTYDPEEKIKNNLYVVTIGASEYKDRNFNLTYAAKDAVDVADLFKSTKGFDKVNVLTLTNEKVTKDGLKEIKGFLKESTINDQVIIFYAGHGVFDAKYNYYLATYDMNFAKPSENGIIYDDLESILSEISPRNKLVMLDACHSGEIDKDEVVLAQTTKVEKSGVKFRSSGNTSVVYKSGLGISSFTLMKNLFTEMNDQTGATILGSAGGMEFAMESGEWKNGLFTYSLIDGLKNKSADANNDGSVTVSEVSDYVRKNVSELSGGKQVPTSRNENIETNFRIW